MSTIAHLCLCLLGRLLKDVFEGSESRFLGFIHAYDLLFFLCSCFSVINKTKEVFGEELKLLSALIVELPATGGMFNPEIESLGHLTEDLLIGID